MKEHAPRPARSYAKRPIHGINPRPGILRKATLGGSWTVGLAIGLCSTPLAAHDAGDVVDRRASGGDATVAERAGAQASPNTDAPPRTIDGSQGGPPPAKPTVVGEDAAGPEANAVPRQAPTERAQEILVTSRRARGSVVGDIEPELTLGTLDLSAYGTDDVEGLIGSLGPQTGNHSGTQDGRPIVLLNGRRTSGFEEISSIPSNAIERLEIFPEELALSYGFRPGQKVVNVVLFNRFASEVANGGYVAQSEGGRGSATASGNYFRIRGPTRYTFDADVSRAGALTEGERGVRQLPENVGSTAYRTLLPRTERASASGTVAGTAFADVAATLNGRFVGTTTESLLGLQDGRPVRQRTHADEYHLGTVLSGSVGSWLWSAVGDYDRSGVSIMTGPKGRDGDAPARYDDGVLDVTLDVSGSPVRLPAGPVRVSLTSETRIRDFSSSSATDGFGRSVDLTRRSQAFRANVDIPITAKQSDRFDGPGKLTANANFGLETLSDAGLLRRSGYGLRWSPVYAVAVYVTSRTEEVAPTLVQLGGPAVATPGVTNFDFARGETSTVALISGGNPTLRASSLEELNVTADMQLLKRRELALSFEYSDVRIHRPIVDLPTGTSRIEAAFPDRFVRDADGRLTQLDVRPLNFARSVQRRLRGGLNFIRTLGAAPPLPPGERSMGVRVYSSDEAARSERPADVRAIEARPGSPAARRLENLTSRVTLSVYYTLNLVDRLTTRVDGPALDFLGGTGRGLVGGTPRHQLEIQAGVFRKGLGARLATSWRSGTTVSDVETNGVGRGSELNFAPYATVDLNLFANVADRLRKSPNWLRGVRISLTVGNVLNGRPRVRDDLGSTPLRYQPQYISPLGRSFGLNIRKLFRA